MQASIDFARSGRSVRPHALTATCFGIFTLVLLAGYAFFGKGFAYLGIPPYAYVGELGLLLGLLALCTGIHVRLWRSAVVWMLVAFMLWGLFRTIPYIGTYGVDAPRDAVIWGYGIYALAVGTVVLRLNAAERVVEFYRRALPIFLIISPIATAIFLFAGGYIPKLPWGPDGGVPVLFLKPGDIAVQYAGAFAFIALGLSSAPLGVGWLFLWAIGSVAFVALGRGPMVTVAAVVGLTMLLRPHLRYFYALAATFLCIGVLYIGVTAFVPNGIAIGGATNGREISIEQIAANVESIFFSDVRSDLDLEGTKEWREKWWDKIIDYTFHGEYFWTGKGFGINLAIDDGFEDEYHQDLRSPHSAHMTVLARMGVPGLALWVSLQIAFLLKMFSTLGIYRRANKPALRSATLWVFLYWLAFLINGSFDVFLEGPQGGIWFWSVIGFGIALIVNADAIADQRRSAGLSPTGSTLAQLGKTHARARSGSSSALWSGAPHNA